MVGLLILAAAALRSTLLDPDERHHSTTPVYQANKVMTWR